MKEEIDVTVRILAAFLSKNNVTKDEMLELIDITYNKVKTTFYQREHHKDGLIQCKCCGKKMHTIRKHLRTQHGLSPEEYFMKFNLPPETGLTSNAYTNKRSSIAKKNELGK